MGSDAQAKSHTNRKYKLQRVTLVSIASLASMLLLLLCRLKPHVPSFATSDYSHIPPNCFAYAHAFHRVQATANSTLVVGCHRKWCQSFGACEPCSGIGSRYRYALSIVEQASLQGVAIQMDAPTQALETLDSVIYRDPYGFLGELLHVRHYGNAMNESKWHWTGDTRIWSEQGMHYLHMTPVGWKNQRDQDFLPDYRYDSCLFPTLLRPSSRLEADLQRHQAQILLKTSMDKRIDRTTSNDLMKKHVIGIHLRTGDEAAFGIQANDVRVGKNLTVALHTMMECAETLAPSLGIPKSKVVYYLATDNGEMQSLAKQYYSKVYIALDQTPSWMDMFDYDAWLDIFLLSRTAGIVANKRVGSYSGGGDSVSTFARLAAKIGFMNESQFLKCPLQVR